MDANNELLQAISQMMDSKLAATLEPISAGQVAMQEDIDQIKEDTAITREAVNGLGEWAEIVADILSVEYPVKK